MIDNKPTEKRYKKRRNFIIYILHNFSQNETLIILMPSEGFWLEFKIDQEIKV